MSEAACTPSASSSFDVAIVRAVAVDDRVIGERETAVAMLLEEGDATLEEARPPAVVVVQQPDVRGTADTDQARPVLSAGQLLAGDDVTDPVVLQVRLERGAQPFVSGTVLGDHQAPQRHGLCEHRLDRLPQVRRVPERRDAHVDQDVVGSRLGGRMRAARGVESGSLTPSLPDSVTTLRYSPPTACCVRERRFGGAFAAQERLVRPDVAPVT